MTTANDWSKTSATEYPHDFWNNLHHYHDLVKQLDGKYKLRGPQTHEAKMEEAEELHRQIEEARHFFDIGPFGVADASWWGLIR